MLKFSHKIKNLLISLKSIWGLSWSILSLFQLWENLLSSVFLNFHIFFCLSVYKWRWKFAAYGPVNWFLLGSQLRCQSLLTVPQQPVKTQPAASSVTQTIVGGSESLMGTLALWVVTTGRVSSINRYACPAAPSSCPSSTSSSSFNSFLFFISGTQNTPLQTDVKREIPHSLILDILWQDTKPRACSSVDSGEDFIWDLSRAGSWHAQFLFVLHY